MSAVPMISLINLIGSLFVAVPLLIAIAGVLVWGTIYEARFGTAAVQRVVYHAWWFQALLAFLAVNLAVAVFQRYPWKRKHVPFVLAHLGIMLILFGGILGGRFGIEGQLIIPEGGAEHVLQEPRNVLVVSQANPGIPHVIPTNFESRAWVHEPHALFTVPLEERIVRLVVDRYYPNAVTEEEITPDGSVERPAIRLAVEQDGHTEDVWLFARDPERFGARFGSAHLLFLELSSDWQLAQLLDGRGASAHERGTVTIECPELKLRREIPVPTTLGAPMPIEGTPYQLTFKDYFADFALTEQGPVSRSDEPNNPAVALVLSGAGATDAHLLFAFHPDFPLMHTQQHTIPVRITYAHPAVASLPPDAITIVRKPDGGLAVVWTGPGAERQSVDPLEPGRRYTHPWLQQQVTVAAYYPKARVVERFENRSDDVRAEAIHVMVQEGEAVADAWVGLRHTAHVTLPGGHPLNIEYRPALRELPVTIKLLDFRKVTYPGIDMAAGFESDVELSDSKRGMILMRKISMNNPLRYRGYSFYQSSFIPAQPGQPDTTVLSVRNDPGTPFVYAGFLIVIGGVVSMFVLRRQTSVTMTRGTAP